MSTRSDHSSKRLRLGTRSCAECRRRKVRCIFTAQSTVCRECLVHDTPCRPQQRNPSTSDNEFDREDLPSLQKRLRNLESIVSRLSNSDPKHDRCAIQDDGMTPDRARGVLLHEQTSAAQATPRSTIHDTPASSEQNFEQPPLIDLFSRTLDVRSHDSKNKDNFGLISRQLSIDEYISALKALLPRIDDLLLILESTAPYWFIWPSQPPGSNDEGSGEPYGKVVMVKDFIIASFASRAPLAVAKSAIWLALCVQQLPADAIQHRKHYLPAPLQTLFDAYMTGADAILTRLGESVATFERFECLILFAKTCINMGKPRQGWFAVRNGINCALILGLHRSNRQINSSQSSLWSQAWQLDRHLSSILGVPYSISHPQPPTKADEQSPISMLLYRINGLVGRISDRNQGNLQISAEEIETELQEYTVNLPKEWWLVMPPEDLSLEDLYVRQTSKLYFWRLKEALYLPGMLKSLENPNGSQIDRERVVEACRNMVTAYEVFRNSSKTALVICDSMDFIVFNAALIIAIHLLAPLFSRNTVRDAEDWGIITHLIQTFRQLSQAIECRVAQQSATLLQYIYTAHRGTYEGPEEYAAVIPWFGKVKIRSVPRQKETPPLPTPPLPNTFSETSDDSLYNMIEFGIGSDFSRASGTSGFGSETWLNYYPDHELGIDWSSLNDIDIEYDWNQIFYTGSTGGSS